MEEPVKSNMSNHDLIRFRDFINTLIPEIKAKLVPDILLPDIRKYLSWSTQLKLLEFFGEADHEDPSCFSAESMLDKIENHLFNEFFCFVLGEKAPLLMKIQVLEILDSETLDDASKIQKIIKQLATHYFWYLREKVRDKLYKNLRGIISNIKNFLTLSERPEGQRDEQFFYAVRKPDNGAVIFSPEQLERTPKDLAPPDRDIFYFQKETRGEETFAWKGKVVEREAVRFWYAFVGENNNGAAAYVPLYAFYRWLLTNLPLRSRKEDLSNTATANDESSTDCWDKAFYKYAKNEHGNRSEGSFNLSVVEICHKAREFVTSLDLLEAEAIAFEKDMTEEKIANAYGVNKNKIHRLKTQIVERLRSFTDMIPELEEDDMRDIFVRCLHFELVKRFENSR